MEYRRIIEELDRMELSKSGLIVLKNSVQKYNFFIRLYNNETNLVDNIKMSSIPCQTLYTIGSSIESSLINFFLVFILFPGMIILCRFLFEKHSYLFFIIMTTYNSSIFLICFMTCIMQYISKQVYKKNKKIIKNPFLNMVYYPDLCTKNNVNNDFLEINIEDLDKLNLNQSQKNKIKENNKKLNLEQGKLRFMIYDQGLIDYYSGIKKSISSIKHKIWFIFSIGMLMFFIFFPWIN